MTYLELVNDICERVNETKLTSANFSTAVGFYSTAKQAVNSAIRSANQQAFEWPFNHISVDLTLTADGTVRYPYVATAKSIDMDSFRVQRNDTFGNETRKLRVMDYNEYLDKHLDDEYNTSNTGIRDLPMYVARASNREFVIFPPADNAYTVTYEYFSLPVDLIAHDDEPSLPDAFRHALIDGAMYYVYMFRGDKDTAMVSNSKFTDSISMLRTIYINNDYEYVRDTRVAEVNYSPVLRTS